MLNTFGMALKAGDLCIFSIFNLFQTQSRKINKSICQTYFWNKGGMGGIKLFLFRETGQIVIVSSSAQFFDICVST